MDIEQKHKIREALKKPQWAEKQKTGHRASKKQLGESIKMTKEWGWEVEAEEVDLERLHKELSNIPCAIALNYLQTLAQKSPIVYKRYRDREKTRRGKFQVWNWNEIDKLQIC